jgi:hypothetical protein
MCDGRSSLFPCRCRRPLRRNRMRCWRLIPPQTSLRPKVWAQALHRKSWVVEVVGVGVWRDVGPRGRIAHQGERLQSRRKRLRPCPAAPPRGPRSRFKKKAPERLPAASFPRAAFAYPASQGPTSIIGRSFEYILIWVIWHTTLTMRNSGRRSSYFPEHGRRWLVYSSLYSPFAMKLSRRTAHGH